MNGEPYTVKERLMYAAMAFALVIAVSGMALGYDLVTVLGIASSFIAGLILPSPVKMELK